MDLNAIISAIADQADELLAGVASMTEARPAIREHLKDKHPKLGAVDVQRVTAGVLAILEDEGFFEVGAAKDSWDDADAREKE
jgi:hypothetical protein